MTTPDLPELRRLVDQALTQSLAGEKFSLRLQEAIVYALLSPGKRLRPLLVLATAFAQAKVKPRQCISYAMPAALAVEYVHTYSLVHDDLPAMDNDDFRRGRPSLHRRFDEALAILAGDALLADAFGLVARAPVNGAELCRELSLSAGRLNLVGGQAEDLMGQKIILSDEQWLNINAKKTARLFEACAFMGGLSVDGSRPVLQECRRFGHHFGIAFQLKDDLDDEACLANSPKVSELLQTHLRMAREAARACAAPMLLEELLTMTFASAKPRLA